MTVNVKFKDSKFKSYTYVFCSFFKEGFLYIRGSGKDIKFAIDKIAHYEIYDYD